MSPRCLHDVPHKVCVRTSSRRALRATCSTARSSVMLMCSPSNMESILPFRLAFSARLNSNCKQQQCSISTIHHARQGTYNNRSRKTQLHFQVFSASAVHCTFRVLSVMRCLERSARMPPFSKNNSSQRAWSWRRSRKCLQAVGKAKL